METTGTTEIGRVALAKATWGLLPLLFLSYVVAYIDRVNVGYAALQMNEELGLSDAVGNLGGFLGPYVVGVVRDATGGF